MNSIIGPINNTKKKQYVSQILKKKKLKNKRKC